ncbi:MAG: hypothetical protein LBI26_03325 [Holosporales bacterium]|jgi:F0F1-type ATP synthase epsilon subunit|nr:hypothetical protein [Holosporales bacterium]
MKLLLTSDGEKFFDGEILDVYISTDKGEVKISDGYTPYISKIKDSISFLKTDKTMEKVVIKEGFVYTNGTVCYAIVDTL